MARGSYETTGNPKPAPKPTPKAGPTLISSDTGDSISTSRFTTLVNYCRPDPETAEDIFSDPGRGGYDITSSPKPAPKPQPEPEKPSK
ncbi:hypothetical protein PG993_013203 [Apiospora rasikravindrae]|uniref:Uncharacterized protein n=1 Tax=Apiospora rasikravindrae TaxID=990691 RepID=A0ABR1RWZ5_9PEZI